MIKQYFSFKFVIHRHVRKCQEGGKRLDWWSFV